MDERKLELKNLVFGLTVVRTRGRAGAKAKAGREPVAEILSEAKDLELVPGVGIEPTRPFRGSGF